jgi:hypothetical protein
MSVSDAGNEEETILEYVVRERLTKEHLSDLLVSLGGQRQGSRDELAERLLGIRGLSVGEVLKKLDTDDLKLIVRRFAIPEPPKPATAGGYLSVRRINSLLGDEKSTLSTRIEEFASKQRAPSPRGSRQTTTPTPQNATTEARPRTVEPQAEPKKPAERPSEAVTRAEPIPEARPATPSPSAAAVGLPVFQETRDFVGAYKFAYQWPSEDLYEAELLGSLRGRFGVNNAVRQQGESGRVYDIVVRNSARIEVKLPKTKADLDRMIGQVRRYLSQHPGGVIVVVIAFQMKNQQEIHNAQEELESAGAVVFVK